MSRTQRVTSTSTITVIAIIFGCAVALRAWPGSVPAGHAQGGSSLRFHGNGVNDIDRVKIKIDTPPRPADVGGDFTIEFWMKALAAENDNNNCSGGGFNWINGNIILDRDIFGDGDYGDFGISLCGSRIAFGVDKGGDGNTIWGSTNVANGAWRHIAVTRDTTSGQLRIFVDGQLDIQGSGPTGDVSYSDGRSTQYPNSDPFIVIGAEKHDYNAQDFPSYSGWVDELRISTVERYDGTFSRPTQPFAPDGNTAALYHFDEGSGDTVGDSSGAAGGPSNGVRHFGGSPAGPEWSADTPFGSSPPPTVTNTAAPGTPTATSTPTKTPTSTPTPTATLNPTAAFATVTALPVRNYLPKAIR